MATSEGSRDGVTRLSSPLLGRDVLIAEDNPVQATLLRRRLQNAGYHVWTARDGEVALRLLEAAPIGLVISDVQMPRVDGHQLCRALKEDAATSHIPVLLLTSLSSPEDLMNGLCAGADAYLTKPYDDTLLLERVASLVGRAVDPDAGRAETVEFAGSRYCLGASRQRILNLLLSTYQNAAQQQRALTEAHSRLLSANQELEARRAESERLLLNVLPKPVCEELAAFGRSHPRRFEDVSVMFTDFVGFTRVAESYGPEELVDELGTYVDHFDGVAASYGLERLKTMGDGFLFVAGVPEESATHAVDCVRAALELQAFCEERARARQRRGRPAWRMRVGIHSGPVVAGVLGHARFAYDVWGDTVNVASRLESAGEPGRVNISAATHAHVERDFECLTRGSRAIKNRGEVEMFFVEGRRTTPACGCDEPGVIAGAAPHVAP